MPPNHTDALLTLDHIECRYQAQAVIQDLSLQLNNEQIVCLLGPSGCGKTTALRAIAGFEPIHQGEIHSQGQSLSRPGYSVPPEKRGFGMVFQDFALFPHLKVADNIRFGLHRVSKTEQQHTIQQLSELLAITELLQRYPHELSGGQQQRVALARALAPKPRLILMDEPFSSLDIELRERLARDIRTILKAQQTAAILVTHDQHEAFAMGDQIGVMKNGQLHQWDSPYALYHEPANRFVADFIGQGRFLRGKIQADGQITTEIGPLRPDPSHRSSSQIRLNAQTPVDVLLRPDDIAYQADSPLQARITERAFKGAEILYTLRLDSGTELLALLASHHNFAIDQRIGIQIQAEHVVSFPVTTTTNA